jgi:diguanylate cyclase (GGDEF)-like protein/PAS domain S-box-containing protein
VSTSLKVLAVEDSESASKPLRVLLVEDSEDDAKLVLRALRRGGFDPTWCRVQTAAELETALARERWDAVISDFRMPGFTGIDALRIFRSTGLDIPFILISGTMGESAAVNAMKAGASDYIMKESLARLAPALERELKETQMRAAHRQAREDLTDSEKRFRQMAENIRDVFFLQDLDGSRMYYVSPAYEQIWGRTCESLYANPASWADAIHPDDRGQALGKFKERGSAGFDFEFRIVRPDGEMRWIQIRGFPVLNDAGNPYRTAGVASDITRRKQAAEALHRSESLKGAILESSLDCVVTIDHEGKIVEFNPAAETTFGLTREHALGKSMVDLIVPPRLREAHRRGFAQYLATGKGPILGKRLELEAIRADGTEFPVELAITALGTTSTPMFTAFIRDITARKQADKRIKRLNRVYAVLSGINTLIVRVRDRDELFKEACRIAVQSGEFPMAWVGLVDPRNEQVNAVAWAGDVQGFSQFTRATAGAKGNGKAGLAAQAIAKRIPVICNDIQADGSAMRYPKEALERGFRSAVALPLVVDGAAIGAMVLYAVEPGFFDDEEMRLLEELAGDISFAIDHIEKQQRMARLSRIEVVMSNIGSLIIRVQNRQELFDEVCRIAVGHGGFALAQVLEVDAKAREVRAVAAAGAEGALITTLSLASGEGRREALGSTVRALREGKLVHCNDISERPDVGHGRVEAVRRGYRSVVSLPLLVGDAVVAVITLYAHEKGFFTEEELRLLQRLAADVAFALDHIAKAEKLNYLAYYDVLTGLANRSLFLERVAQYMRGAVSGGHKLALFLVDLERFKNINDSLGQPAGDALLKQVAEWLTHNVGDANLLARLGADHFAVVLPEMRQEGNVARLLEKSLEAFLEHPFRLNDAVFRIAAKVGVAVYPDDGANADTLLKNAEAALKKAKATGDRYLFYTQKMTETVAAKLTLENQLRRALDNEEFVLHYQPKVNLATGKLTSAEALIRWNDPRTGLVPPGRFIPVLEETGLIHDVGRWALRKAIEDYLRWRAAGLPAVRIAVNVSPLQLRSRGFIAEIKDAIGIDAHAAAGLELELTESLIMEDVKHSIASLQAIRAMGVSIAIDDFGTGFSSLSYLAKLPVDTLKIDRTFVIDMTASPAGLALVSTIISLAHSLKLKVVAEGVETEEQSRLLRLLNCDEMQGFLFSKPLPGEIFETTFLAPSNERRAA